MAATKSKAKGEKKGTAKKAGKAAVKVGVGGARKMKLADGDVRFIRKRAFLRENGEKVPGKSNDLSHDELATKYDCSKRAIYNIATRRSYAEVAD